MSIFLSPSIERNLCFLVDKMQDDDSDSGEKSQEKVKIWVSKELLAVASPVFNAMIYGDFRESHLPSTEPIYLPEKNDEDFLKFLDCLFPYPTQSDIDESNIEAILRLSNEYQVEYLMKKCDRYYEKVIRDLGVANDKVLVYLTIILKYKLKRALEICLPYMATLDVKVLSKHRFQNVPAIDGYDQVYFAVYEAKLRRHLDGKCGKCHKTIPGEAAEYARCHTCGLKGYSCICGYEFESIHLNW
uniref:BTB domain-containing protein n=1 Tax=Romanomermis culicivorax TaxID=13658 RepID=A0A915KNY6_ROMCU